MFSIVASTHSRPVAESSIGASKKVVVGAKLAVPNFAHLTARFSPVGNRIELELFQLLFFVKRVVAGLSSSSFSSSVLKVPPEVSSVVASPVNVAGLPANVSAEAALVVSPKTRVWAFDDVPVADVPSARVQSSTGNVPVPQVVSLRLAKVVPVVGSNRTTGIGVVSPEPSGACIWTFVVRGSVVKVALPLASPFSWHPVGLTTLMPVNLSFP